VKLPLLDLRAVNRGDVRADAVAAFNVTLMSIPQGIAYALIAGLPPVMGLYAAFLPAIVGALFRSSRHVISEPTNAISLLVGTAVAARVGSDPVTTAMLLALMVGVIQVGAGVLRLGVLVDFVSMPVVVGYIVGAGGLIVVGQLPSLTATAGAGAEENLFVKLVTWARHLEDVSLIPPVVGGATILAILGLRRWRREIPAPLIVLASVTALSWLFGFGEWMQTISDMASVPPGLPMIELPAVGGWADLVPVAVAVTFLSLLESTAVARTLALRSGQRLDTTFEFIGQGLANLTASVAGGYPTSGSLARSALNYQGGARSRLAGVFSGLYVGAALLFLGPVINHTPIAALSGLLMVIAADIIDVRRVRSVIRGRRSDAAAFAATLIGTWTLRLDQAIYFGIAVSLFFYLRRSRMLRIRPLHFAAGNRIVEGRGVDSCSAIRILQIDGPLFFAASGELQAALDEVVADPEVQVLVLRLRRALDMDVTVAGLLATVAVQLRESGRRLALVGLHSGTRDLLARTGALDAIGAAYVFRQSDRVLAALEAALGKLHEALPPHRCGGALAD
jgi:SulP family sulfate permease